MNISRNLIIAATLSSFLVTSDGGAMDPCQLTENNSQVIGQVSLFARINGVDYPVYSMNQWGPAAPVWPGVSHAPTVPAMDFCPRRRLLDVQTLCIFGGIALATIGITGYLAAKDGMGWFHKRSVPRKARPGSHPKRPSTGNQ
jgi:hypothetical protein